MGKPKLRFQGYTDDWEQRKLGEIAIEILAGGDIDKEKVVDDGAYPIYANALTNDGIVGYYNDYYRVKAPAVTVTGRGEVGHARARMTDFTPVVRLLAIRSSHDCYFLENAINNHKVVVESTGVPQLTVPQLSSYDICFPKDIEEEKKIGAYYKKLDHLITLHQRKCEEIKKLKKYMLQKMFPKKGMTVPEIRFDGFTDDWEQRKFSDVIEKLIGGVSIAPDDYVDIGYRTIPKGAVNSSGVADLSGSKNVPEDFFEKNISSKTSTGELVTSLRDLVPTAPNMGRIVRIYGDSEDFLMPQGVYSIIVKKKISEDYLITYSNSPEYRKIIMAKKNGSTQVHIRNGEFLNIDIPLPSYKEQREIGEYFKKLDHLITLHRRKCEELQKLKKFMLQNMFV